MDNEIWKAVKGYEGIYEISSLGKLKSLDRVIKNKRTKDYLVKGKIMHPRTSSWGYKNVCLSKDGKIKVYNIHRLVLIAFKENPNNYPMVNHINGDKKDNRLQNLEWCNCSQNIIHSYKMGRKAVNGEQHGRGKLKEIDARMIIFLKNILSTKDLSYMFSVSCSQINRIKQGLRWEHLKLATL